MTFMQLVYQPQGHVEIEEKTNQYDFAFYLKIEDESLRKAYFQVREFFENDHLYTDVLFYTHQDHRYEAIVRKDYYIDFLLALFKYKLLINMTWE